jgi:hypothetical protein
MRNGLAIIAVVILSLLSDIVFAADAATAKRALPVLRYVSLQQASADAVVVETRALSLCRQRTLANAHCLPATDLLGPNGELPSFADIFWALGTAGLTGKETILVVGNQDTDRDFIAGLLYLCGQARVEILDTPVAKVLRDGILPVGEGQPRAILRQQIYRASMRDASMVLPGELPAAQDNDGRLMSIDADHPQALKSAVAELQQDKQNTHAQYVVYAGRPKLAIAMFTRLLADTVAQNAPLRVVPIALHEWVGTSASPAPQDDMTASVQVGKLDGENNSRIRFFAGVVMVSIPVMILLIASFTKGGKLWI